MVVWLVRMRYVWKTRKPSKPAPTAAATVKDIITNPLSSSFSSGDTAKALRKTEYEARRKKMSAKNVQKMKR